MKKTTVLLVITLMLLSACSSRNVTNVSNTQKSNQEKVQFGDPFILLHEGTYYAYGTNAHDGIEVYTSEDLKYWKKQKQLALHKDNSYGEKWFWASEVYFVNGKFYMYYSAEEHICVATADSPFGPFKQSKKEPMLANKAIDNSLFIDDDGKSYLLYVNFDNPGLSTWIAELEEDLVTIKQETKRKIIETSQDWERVHPSVNEGPYILKHKGKYYMTYSGNSYESQFYGVGLAKSDSLLGKWTKYDKNPIFQKPGNLVGVGHSAMFRDKKGNLKIVFHAHNDTNNIHPRHMYISSASFINGVLRIDPNFITPYKIE